MTELVSSNLNNKLLLCLTETNQFIIVLQFYNTTGCPLIKKKIRNHNLFALKEGDAKV